MNQKHYKFILINFVFCSNNNRDIAISMFKKLYITSSSATRKFSANLDLKK